MSDSQTKRVCPIHQPAPTELPLSEFGVCRARKDGRNLYCKACIRVKVTANRRALKEYRAARKQRRSDPSLFDCLPNEAPPSLSKLAPIERVRKAIAKGARTQREIAQETRLSNDEIGDALANLLLWTREISTRVVDNIRQYFIREDSNQQISNQPVGVARKPDVLATFSAPSQVMPVKWRAG